jgi:hypothetical protein
MGLNQEVSAPGQPKITVQVFHKRACDIVMVQQQAECLLPLSLFEPSFDVCRLAFLRSVLASIRVLQVVLLPDFQHAGQSVTRRVPPKHTSAALRCPVADI